MEETKKKSFWKGKLGIAIIASMAFMLIATSSVYAYSFFSGSAEVTVDEAITMTCLGGDGSWDGSQWTVSLYPGETKTLNLQFNNISSAMITVNPTVTVTVAPSGWVGHFDCDFVSATYDVPAGGSIAANLEASADTSAPPGLYTCTIDVSR